MTLLLPLLLAAWNGPVVGRPIVQPVTGDRGNVFRVVGGVQTGTQLDLTGGVLNPRHAPWNAACDGTTDDYAALATMIATLQPGQENAGKGVVVTGNCASGTSFTIPSTSPVRFEAGGTFSGAGVATYTAATYAANVSQSTVLATGSTTARTQADRAADVVNVRDFGAVGNGVADDTAAIQAALDTGKNVDFLGLSFRVSTALRVVTSRQKLIGRGAIITTIGAGTGAITVGSAAGGAFVKTDDVIIDRFTLVGAADGVSANPPAAIQIQQPTTNPYVEGGGCSRVTIQDVTISGFAVAISATAADRLLVQGCRFNGSVYYPSLVAGGYGVLLQTVFKPHVVNNVFTAVATDRHAIYVSVDSTRAADANNVCKEVTVSGNAIDWRAVNGVGPTGFESAVHARSPLGLTFLGNTLRGGYGGLRLSLDNAASTDVAIIGNTFSEQIASASQNAGVALVSSAGAFTGSRLNITGNTFSTNSAQLFGVSLAYFTHVTVAGNAFNLASGIACIGVGGTVTKATLGPNTIESAARGYYFTGTGNDQITLAKGQENTTGLYADFNSTPTNLGWGFARSATVRANSTSSPAILSDPYGIVASVATNTFGIDVTFYAGANLSLPESVVFTTTGSSVGQAYRRAVSGQTLTIGVLSSSTNAVDGTSGTHSHTLLTLPAASNSYDIAVTLLR